MPRSLIILVFLPVQLLTLVLSAGCDDSSGPFRVTTPINESLVPILYWGATDDPFNSVPNRGTRAGFVVFPVWSADTLLFAYSGAIFDGVVRQGIYAINIEPASLAYKSSTPFDLGVILSWDYDSESECFLATKFLRGGGYLLLRGDLRAHALTIQDTLWGQLDDFVSARFVDGRDDFVYHKFDGNDAGFYTYRSGQTNLLARRVLSFYDAIGFAVRRQQRQIIYGVTSGVGSTGSFDLRLLDLESGVDTVIVNLRGAFNGAAVSPVNGSEVALFRAIREPGGPLESNLTFLNLDTGSRRSINTRTSPSLVWDIENSSPAYSPDGGKVAFSSTEFTSSGGVRPHALWAYVK